MKTSKQMNWIVAVLGAWELVTPFIFGYLNKPVAMWNAIIVGLALIVLAVYSAMNSDVMLVRILNWVTFLVGGWLLVSPFILHFLYTPFAEWNAIAVGLVVLALEIEASISASTATSPQQ